MGRGPSHSAVEPAFRKTLASAPMRRPSDFTAAIRLVLALLLSGWTNAFAGEPARVVILTPHPEEIRREFDAGFRRWHQERFGVPVSVEWRDYGGSGDAQRILESEYRSRPEGIGIDVFFGGGPEPYHSLADLGLLARHRPDPRILEGVPRVAHGVELYDTNHLWFGACLASFGILQNTRVQRELGLPRAARWTDLADPRYLGWVGAGDPRNSGTMNNMFEAFLQYHGWEAGWSHLTRIAANIRSFDRISSTTAKECALGQVACAFAIDYYGFIQIAAVGPGQMEMVLPADFTAVTPDGVARLRGGPNPETAGRFLDYLLSAEAQRLWYLPAGVPGGPVQSTLERLPIRPDVYARDRDRSRILLNPFELKQDFHYDTRLAGRRRSVVRALFGAALIDPHPELQRAWKHLIAVGLPPAAVEELGRPLVTESEAEALLKEGWGRRDGAERRIRTTIAWQKRALERYERLARWPEAP